MSAIEPIAKKDAPTTFIYALVDPRTREIRYIGKTDKPAARLGLHIRTSASENTYRARWIRSLVAKGLRPILQIIDKVCVHDWQAAEAAYIIFFREEGCDLTNATPGGEGLGSGEDNPLFGKPRTPEMRSRIRAKLMGHSVTPETIAKLSVARKGKPGNPMRPRVRELLRKINLGRKMSDTARENMRIAGKNRKPPSDETRARMSIANKGDKNGFFGKKHGPETVAKMRAAKLGRTLSAETRAKLVISQRQRRQCEARIRHLESH
jgi:hypothetical protein